MAVCVSLLFLVLLAGFVSAFMWHTYERLTGGNSHLSKGKTHITISFLVSVCNPASVGTKPSNGHSAPYGMILEHNPIYSKTTHVV